MKPQQAQRFRWVCWLIQLLFIYPAFAQDSLTVKHIGISGNHRTKDEIILREILFHEGQKVAVDALPKLKQQSEKFLFNTSLFLSTAVKDSIDGGDLYIAVSVRERWYILPSLIFDLSDRNFTEWIEKLDLYRITYGLKITDYNFRGRRERLSLQVVGGWRQSFLIDYKIPYLNRKKTVGIQFRTFYEQGHEVGALTRNNELEYLRVNKRNIFYKRGADVTLSLRKKYRVSHYLQAGYDYYNVDDTVARERNPDYLGHRLNRLAVPRLMYQFVWDKRDYVFYPTTGHYLSAVLEKDGLFSRNLDITTADLSFRKYGRLAGPVYYQTGFLAEKTFSAYVPYIFRSSLGYRYQVRGYEHYLIDGNAFLLLAHEARIKIFDRKFRLPYIDWQQFNPVPVRVYFKLFADQGYVHYQPVQYKNTLLNKALAGWGAGLDILSYYDKIMRIEYSFNNLGQSGLFLQFLEVF